MSATNPLGSYAGRMAKSVAKGLFALGCGPYIPCQCLCFKDESGVVQKELDQVALASFLSPTIKRYLETNSSLGIAAPYHLITHLQVPPIAVSIYQRRHKGKNEKYYRVTVTHDGCDEEDGYVFTHGGGDLHRACALCRRDVVLNGAKDIRVRIEEAELWAREYIRQHLVEKG